MVSVYSLTHFFVDFACAFFLFRFIAGTLDAHLCFLLYNFCAFALQMPLGIIVDRVSKNYLFAITGCVLVGLVVAVGALWAAGVVATNSVPVLVGITPIVMTVAIGTGNALFHLGGGIDILNISQKKAGALGIFVSPGAAGIFLGALLGKGATAVAPPLLLALFVAVMSIVLVRRAQGTSYPRNAIFSLKPIASSQILVAALCLFLVVCLRSYVGLALGFSWKSVFALSVTTLCAVALGKAFGGFASDKLGAGKTALISLGLATMLYAFSTFPFAGIAAIFLFNMTMPITLWALARVFPGAKGFAFGLLTFALFLGFLPTYLGIAVFVDASWLLALASLISLVLLLLGLRLSGNHKNAEKPRLTWLADSGVKGGQGR